MLSCADYAVLTYVVFAYVVFTRGATSIQNFAAERQVR